MTKPVILAVDDEPRVLAAVVRDLRTHYENEYRILSAKSGDEALETVRELRKRDTPLALLLVDQRMPGMTGVELLEEALGIYPDSKRVLLTAYADTDVAIASINSIGLDYYLVKPWHPPEELLYPVLDDLLDDWAAAAPVPYDGIRVAGTLWSASTHAVKEFLARSQVPYQWLDVERDASIREVIETTPEGRLRLPTLLFPDGTTLVEPDIRSLADKIGFDTEPDQPFYDLIIVGAGPAGLAAAVCAASEGVRTVVVEKEAPGGQAGTSSRIENYLGFPQGISGADLTRRATTQARRLGAEILTAQEVTGIRVQDSYRHVTLGDGTELSCHALLVATGVTVRELEAPGIERLVGASVYYGAASSEAAHYRDRKVFVIGGGNSAGQGAMYLSRFASEVTILVRGPSLDSSMSRYLIDQIDATENITVRTRTQLSGVSGTERLEAVTIEFLETGETEHTAADAVFIFVGSAPHTDIVADVVERDEEGFIVTGPDLMRTGKRPRGWTLPRDPYLLETSVPGIFAAGDVRHGVIRRVASAVGQGAVAVSFVHKYLESV